jgi:hypothetical protein
MAMKPMIDAAIANGEILDENGNAYESAEAAGITYSQTMSEMFESLIKKIDDFVSAIRGIEPEPITIPVQYDVQGQPTGGRPQNSDDVPGFAEGTGFRFVDFGQESIVALHGREMVLNEDQVGQLGGLGGVHNETNLEVNLSPFQTQRTIQETTDYLIDQMENAAFNDLALRASSGEW